MKKITQSYTDDNTCAIVLSIVIVLLISFIKLQEGSSIEDRVEKDLLISKTNKNYNVVILK